MLTKEMREDPWVCKPHHDRWCACNVARAFASATLGMITARKRSELEAIVTRIGAWTEDLDVETALKLRRKVELGEVQSLSANPEPYLYVHLKGSWGHIRSVYGLNLQKRASFFGNAPKELPRFGTLTREQAIAKGIPMPEEKPDGDS